METRRKRKKFGLLHLPYPSPWSDVHGIGLSDSVTVHGENEDSNVISQAPSFIISVCVKGRTKTAKNQATSLTAMLLYLTWLHLNSSAQESFVNMYWKGIKFWRFSLFLLVIEFSEACRIENNGIATLFQSLEFELSASFWFSLIVLL